MDDTVELAPPLVPDPSASKGPDWKTRTVLGSIMAMLRVTMVISPRPTALLARRLFARAGAEQAARLDQGAPTAVTVLRDVAYGPGPDERMDLYRPAGAERDDVVGPTVVWVHGGAWVGGSKEELAGWFRRLAASADVTVAAISYSLAPAATSPTPLLQALRATHMLEEHGSEFGVDARRLFVGGDSAGAQIAAQVGAVASSEQFASLVGSPYPPPRLRGLVLCCGPYDVRAFGSETPIHHLVDAIMWAYSGVRRWRSEERFLSTMAVVDHVGEHFPPTFVTVGNADALAPQTDLLEASLHRSGVDVDSLRFSADHTPALGHEYQFDVRLEEAATALRRIAEFLSRHRDTR